MQRILSSLVLITAIIIVSGCSPLDNYKKNMTVTVQSTSSTHNSQHSNSAAVKAVQTHSITLAEIKNRSKYKKRTIINTTTFENYVLVESQYPRETSSEFDWYNLKTGQMNVLPSYTFVAKLYKIIDPNHIILLSNGTDSNSSFKVFPYYIYCVRGSESNEFHPIYRWKYFPLSHPVQFGLKPNEVINDMKVTVNGIQILFGPAKGKQGEFYADDTTIPVTNTSYDEASHTFVVEFEKTTWNPTFLSSGFKNLAQNQYVDSIQAGTSGDTCIVRIKTKNLANYFHGAIKQIHNGLPFLELTFYDKNPNSERLNLR